MAEKIPKGKLVVRKGKKGEAQKILSGTVHPNSTYFVASCDGKIVGACECRLDSKTGVIADMEVVSRFKGRGIGHKLLGKAHSFFESKGIKSIKTVPIIKSKGFYEKAGYKQIQKGFQKMQRISPSVKNLKKGRRRRK